LALQSLRKLGKRREVSTDSRLEQEDRAGDALLAHLWRVVDQQVDHDVACASFKEDRHPGGSEGVSGKEKYHR